MTSPPIRSVGTVLTSAPEFGTITRRAKRLLEIQRALIGALPKSLADHATVANVVDGTVVILARNGTVAAKLKQLLRRLLVKLRQQDREINAIRVRVQEPNGDKPLPQKHISLSSPAREALLALSKQLHGSPLGRSVEKLAQRIDAWSDNECASFESVKNEQNQ